MTPWRAHGVSMRAYVDRCVDDLRRYHDATVADVQAEIDRRLGANRREMDHTAEATGTRLGLLEERLRRAEIALERQTGRRAVYAALAGIAGVIVALVTLVVNHIRL